MKNSVSAILVVMTLLFSASTAFAANGYDEEYAGGDEGVTYKPDYDGGDYGYEPESPVWGEQLSFTPAMSDNFVWQGHDPAKEGWSATYGDMDQANLIHWSDNGLYPLSYGGHIFEISPKNSKMVIMAKDFTGNAGDWLVVDKAVIYDDYFPYMDSAFGFIEDAEGNTTTVFSSIVTDGSSENWEQSWTYLETDGPFTLYLGAMNGLDEEFAPKLLIGEINVFTFGGEKGLADVSPAPVPVPGAALLFGSAIGGLTIIRRRKEA